MGGHLMIEPTHTSIEMHNEENTPTDELVNELAELGIERVKPSAKSIPERGE